MDSVSKLDLSKFPKIDTAPTKWDIREANERSSRGLTKIREISENLLDAIHAYINDLGQLDSQTSILDQERAELAEIDKQLRYSQQQLEQKESSLNEQLKYIERRNKELEDKKLQLEEKQANNLKDIQEREARLRHLEKDPTIS